MDDIIEVAETDQGTTDQNGAVMTADVPFDAPSQPHVDAVAASVHTIPPAASQLANAGALEIEEVSRHTIGSTLAIFPTTGSTVIHLPAIGSTTAIVSTGFSPRLRPEHGTTLKPLLAPNHRAEASWPQRAERGERERGFLSRRPLILGERDEPPLPRRSPPRDYWRDGERDYWRDGPAEREPVRREAERDHYERDYYYWRDGGGRSDGGGRGDGGGRERDAYHYAGERRGVRYDDRYDDRHFLYDDRYEERLNADDPADGANARTADARITDGRPPLAGPGVGRDGSISAANEGGGDGGGASSSVGFGGGRPRSGSSGGGALDEPAGPHDPAVTARASAPGHSHPTGNDGAADEDDSGAMEEGELEADADGDDTDPSAIRSLVVGELTEAWMDESYLQTIFRALGEPLTGCRVARDWSDGQRRSKGYAVVQLASARACRSLLRKREGGVPALHPYRFDLRPAKTPCSVYVGSLEMPYLTPPLLRYVFSDEQIAKTHLPHDETGKLRGYGFITFTTDATAQRIMKSHHNTPLGRGKAHPLHWASANLVVPGTDAFGTNGGFEFGGASTAPLAAALDFAGHNPIANPIGTSLGNAFGDAPPLAFNEGLGGDLFGSSNLLSVFGGSRRGGMHGGGLGGGRGEAERDEPPFVMLVRAQELHLQAKAVGRHSASSRLEMAARAQRLLEGLIGQLTAQQQQGVPTTVGGE